MTKLLIDAGNTRIKWATLQNAQLSPVSALACAQANELSAHWQNLPHITSVWVSNVAGEIVARHIETACAARGWKVNFITAQREQNGVRNGYDVPQQLGSDRWAALIAARNVMNDSIGSTVTVSKSALVVNCGTATTIDALSTDGKFLGGLILPGVEMMQSALAARTAQLQNVAGKVVEFPRNTADAMASGAVLATCGAIVQYREKLGEAEIFLSGGAAQIVRENLYCPARWMENMVLQGLAILARENDA